MPLILGVDHVCASCTDPQQRAGTFQQLGFQTVFEENGLPILEKKKPFLRKNCSSHSMVFLKPSAGLSVEMIAHHDSLYSHQAPYHVLLGTLKRSSSSIEASNTEVVRLAIEQALGMQVTPRFLREQQISYFQPNVTADLVPGVALVALEYADLDAALTFWQKGIGFQTVKKSTGTSPSWCLLQFVALVSAWSLKILLIESKSSPVKSFLDDSGWTCLSFMVTSIEKCLEQLRPYGIMDIGTPYSMTIGGRTMRLCFFRGPEMTLIELIQPEQK